MHAMNFLGMVRQKAMKQGRNVHGIPLLDVCSDHNITSINDVWPCWGHAYSISVSKWLLDWHIQYPNLRHICRVHIRGWDSSVEQNMLAFPGGFIATAIFFVF